MSNLLVITGGSRGIGEATIQRFMKENWDVVNLSRNPSSINQVKNIQVDLSDAASISQHGSELQSLMSTANHVSVVHNAAHYIPDCLDTLDLDNLQTTLAVNILSPVALNQVLVPHMPPHSSIIYIGTTLARKAVPGSASYAISKHGMIGLMKATCQDLIGKKIRSCCVNPGLVDTQLLKDTMDQETQDFLLENQIIGKRLIEPYEIADVIYFCATTPCLNGAIIDANLGQVAD